MDCPDCDNDLSETKNGNIKWCKQCGYCNY